MYNTDC